MSAPTLVLLPGLDGTELFFGPLIDALGAGYPVRCVRYPDAGPYDHAALLPRVREAMQGCERVVLVATSFGGPLAILAAAEAPARIAGLVLIASFARAPRRWPWLWRAVATTPVVAALRGLRRLPVWLGRAGNDPFRVAKRETWTRVSARGLAGRGRALLATDRRRRLAALELPMLVVGYRHDRVVPRRHVEELLRWAPHARLQLLPGGHHGLFHNPQPLAALLREFIAQATQSSPALRDALR